MVETSLSAQGALKSLLQSARLIELHLKSCDLGTDIIECCPAFAHCPSLQVLILEENQLGTNLHSLDLSCSTNLRVLNLAHNELDFTLPGCIPYLQRCTNLHHLDISFNSLQPINGFATTLQGLRNLEQLSLVHTGMDTDGIIILVPQLSPLSQLRQLDLGCNPIDAIRDLHLRKLPWSVIITGNQSHGYAGRYPGSDGSW